MPDIIITLFLILFVVFLASCLIIPITLFYFYLKDRKLKANVPELIKKEVELKRLKKEIEIQKRKGYYAQKSTDRGFEEEDSSGFKKSSWAPINQERTRDTNAYGEQAREDFENRRREPTIEERDTINSIKREIRQSNRVQLPTSSNIGSNKERIKLHKPSNL